jgi:very-short-patch-repair endonuclease
MSALSSEAQAYLEDFHWDEAEYKILLSGPVMKDLIRRAIRVQTVAMSGWNAPPGPPGGKPGVRTGTLRRSIGWRPGLDVISPYVDVGTAVVYACVFDSHTQVVTENGPRTIGQVQPGERVLTQTGEFRTLLAKTAFPAVEKPDLVDIEIDWRSDRKHHLTLTLDHKVLVRRDGRNLWVMAGDLRGGDFMYDRTKISHTKGTGRWKVCEWCEGRHQGQGRRYCSKRCRDTAWASGLNPHLGMIRSEATRKKLSDQARARGAGLTLNRRLAERGFRTALEVRTEEWLIERGVAYECQVPIGEHIVDFFLPGSREIIEADGAYWHQDQAKDIARDRDILRCAPGVQITHLHFYEKRFTPPLDAEPIPGARYVACNPSPGSFVDPEVFRARPVRIVRQWRYGETLRPKGSARAMLYDIAVEGVHSFLASGVIVSNSYVEMGTSRMAARPYLRPALEAASQTY